MNTSLILLSIVCLAVAIYQYVRRTNAEEELKLQKSKTMYFRNSKGQMQKA